jgi:hypothetical protein
MFLKGLGILAMLGSVIGALYAGLSFHQTNRGDRVVAQAEPRSTNVGQAGNVSVNDARSSGGTVNIGAGSQIQQNSYTSNSPNVISGGNVNIFTK